MGLAVTNGTHSRIIAKTAKAELDSLGFRQKGRSRLWVADRGSWLNLVEFTPSRWSTSVSLINAAHWLWLGAGFTSFNESISSNCQVEFETEGQFGAEVVELARTARVNASVIDERFSSFEAIAGFVVERARGSPERMAPSWWGYEAGVASALVGRFDEAARFLHGLTDNRVIGRAAALLPLLADPEAFKRKVNEVVAQERERLNLQPLDGAAF